MFHRRWLLTLLQYFSEVLVVAGAVPAAEAELVLALAHAQLGALGDLVDDLGLALAQLRLLARQALRLPANAVGVHDQGAPHGPAAAEQRVRLVITPIRQVITP